MALYPQRNQSLESPGGVIGLIHDGASAYPYTLFLVSASNCFRFCSPTLRVFLSCDHDTIPSEQAGVQYLTDHSVAHENKSTHASVYLLTHSRDG